MEEQFKKDIIKILEHYEFDPAKGFDSNDRFIDSVDYDSIAKDFIQLAKDYKKDL